MPFITLYLPRGCDDGALETSMREITAAGAELLENTLERMIRVTVLEADPERVYQGGAQAEKLAPTVLFRVGPGRSAAPRMPSWIRLPPSSAGTWAAPRRTYGPMSWTTRRATTSALAASTKTFQRR